MEDYTSLTPPEDSLDMLKKEIPINITLKSTETEFLEYMSITI